MKLRIGCTGWSYEGWKENFYPKNLTQSKWLNFYSSIFDTTEVNSTFYNIPSPVTTLNWFKQTPENFWFTVKLVKSITHDYRLKPNAEVDKFLNSMKPLGSKLKVIVIQLPPSLMFEDAEINLKKLLNYLPKNYRYAVEGRHASWFSEKSLKFCKINEVSLVWNVIEGVDNPAPITSDFIYLRMVGDRSIPDEKFGKTIIDRSKIIMQWATKLKNQKSNISFAIAMLNNHFGGFAPDSVNLLRESLGMEKLSWIDSRQKNIMDF